MKNTTTTLFPFTLLALGLVGCASEPKVQTVYVLPPRIPGEREAVQHPSFLKAYPLGRYVDPNDSSVMHESHVIYVEEQPTAWNLLSNRRVYVPLGPQAAPPDAARAPDPTTDELRREIDAQRKASRALTNQAGRILEAQSQLSAVVPLVRQSVEQSVALQQQQRVMEERMRLLEEGLRPSARVAGTTNPPPAVVPSKEW